MNEAATVEYNVIKNIETMTLEQLRPEINALYHQTEAVGNIAIMMMAETGRMLLAVKDKVKHGEFETWCGENLDFSKSKAEKMMKLAEKTADENSIFSNPYTFTDLSISKVLTLLAAPEDIAIEVIETGNAEELSVRELKETIKELKEKRKQEINDLKLQLEEAKSNAGSSENAEELKKKLEKEKEKNTKLKAKQDKEIADAVQAAREEARADAEKDSAEEIRRLNSELEKEQTENLKLSNQLHASKNDDLIEFRIQSKAMQECFNSCVEIIDRVSATDREMANKMTAGLAQILEAKLADIGE